MRIEYALGWGGVIRLSVYNSAGELVQILAEGRVLPQELYYVAWDLTDREGAPVSSNVYVIRLDVEESDTHVMRKLAVIR